MPSTINGIGTWYYGKKNIIQRQGSCEHCGCNATLTSFDTTLFFVVLFIPLIPMGKKRVIDKCSSCTRHRAMPLKQWDSARSQALEEAQMKLRQKSSDAATAHEFLAACTAFQSRDVFDQGARDIRRHLAGNAEVMNHLAAAFFSFGMWADAEDASRAALKVNDTHETREFLAYTLIKQGRPDDAAYYMSHLYNASQADNVGYLFLLAEAFQAQGEHRKALQVLDQCAGIVPGLTKDKEFKKLRRISEKNRDSRKAIKHKELATGDVMIKSGSGAATWLPLIIGPIVLLGLLGLYLFTSHSKGQSREVYLANGLSKPYSVRIAGEEYGIPPMRVVPIKIKEGDVTVEVVGDEFAIEPQTATITTPFWTRPFLNRTVVLNPDRTAPVVYEKIWYVAEGKEDKMEVPEGERVYHVGEFMYDFSGLDFKFEEFPDSIKMSSGSSKQSKDRVALLQPGEMLGGSVLIGLMLGGEDDKAVELSKRRLALEPDQSEFLNYLSRKLEPGEFIELIKPGLAARPLRVQWHRAYQSVSEAANPDRDLVAEYEALLAAEPDNKDLHYLLGRVMDDPDEAVEEYRLAASEPEPSVYGLGALAYRLVAQGSFADAVPFAEKAYDLDPKNDLAYPVLRYALMGSAGYERHLALLARQIEETPRMTTLYFDQAAIYAIQGRDDLVDDTIRRADDAVFGRDAETDGPSYIEQAIRSQTAYIKGDFEEYKEAESYGDDELVLFHVALTMRDLDQAVKVMDEDYIEYEEADWSELLLLHAALMRKGDAVAAAKYLNLAIEQMNGMSNDYRKAARWLAGESSPTARDLQTLPLLPDEKRVVLVGLGARFPQLRSECFALAGKLNVNREYPWHFIRDMVNSTEWGR